MTNFKVNAEERLAKIAEMKAKGMELRQIAFNLGIGYIGLQKWIARQEEKKNPKPKPKYEHHDSGLKTKTLSLSAKEQEDLAMDKTLIFGEGGVPQFALMPYSKYALLVVEADKEKVKPRLTIERR